MNGLRNEHQMTIHDRIEERRVILQNDMRYLNREIKRSLAMERKAKRRGFATVNSLSNNEKQSALALKK